MGKELWYLLVRGVFSKKVSAMVNFYVHEEELGSAIRNGRDYAKVIGIRDFLLLEAIPLSCDGNFNPLEDAVGLSHNVYVGKEMVPYQPKAGQSSFIYPTGIVKSAENGLLELPGDIDHFVVSKPAISRHFTITVVLGNDHLEGIFFHLLGLIPRIDSFTITVKDYCRKKNKAELFISHTLTTKVAIVGFIRRNCADTLENGFVEMSFKTVAGTNCFTLDDHKVLTLKTTDEHLFKLVCASLKFHDIKESDHVHVPWIENKHWHYRPCKSLDRKEFIKFLLQEGFMPCKTFASWMEQLLQGTLIC
ncbi:hypothetical protein [Pontibacter pudoricolor]|uniref:hypothetical protein n=1 Tax=Pontibacter pudoricolor TaxID=2694930 RepID=UPI00139093A6|nr:hypothetical protein [Pontibacter pudoricolor]